MKNHTRQQRQETLRDISCSAAITAAYRARYRGAFFGPEHAHPETHHLSFIVRGRARFTVDGRRYEAGENEAVFVRAGRFHRSFPPGENQPYELLEVKFTLPGPAAGVPTVFPLAHFRAEFLALFREFIEEFQLGRPYRETALRACLARLMLICCRNAEWPGRDRRLPVRAPGEERKLLVAQAVAFLQENHARKITVTALAREMHASPGHLGHAFREVAGRAPIAWLNRFRLEQALLLMERTDRKLADIARETGFRDQYYFSRCFRKTYGLAPRRYLKCLHESRPGRNNASGDRKTGL